MIKKFNILFLVLFFTICVSANVNAGIPSIDFPVAAIKGKELLEKFNTLKANLKINERMEAVNNAIGSCKKTYNDLVTENVKRVEKEVAVIKREKERLEKNKKDLESYVEQQKKTLDKAKKYRDQANKTISDVKGYKDQADKLVSDAKGYKDQANKLVSDAKGYKDQADKVVSDVNGYKKQADKLVSDAKSYKNKADNVVNNTGAAAKKEVTNKVGVASQGAGNAVARKKFISAEKTLVLEGKKKAVQKAEEEAGVEVGTVEDDIELVTEEIVPVKEAIEPLVEEKLKIKKGRSPFERVSFYRSVGVISMADTTPPADDPSKEEKIPTGMDGDNYIMSKELAMYCNITPKDLNDQAVLMRCLESLFSNMNHPTAGVASDHIVEFAKILKGETIGSLSYYMREVNRSSQFEREDLKGFRESLSAAGDSRDDTSSVSEALVMLNTNVNRLVASLAFRGSSDAFDRFKIIVSDPNFRGTITPSKDSMSNMGGYLADTDTSKKEDGGAKENPSGNKG